MRWPANSILTRITRGPGRKNSEPVFNKKDLGNIARVFFVTKHICSCRLNDFVASATFYQIKVVIGSFHPVKPVRVSLVQSRDTDTNAHSDFMFLPKKGLLPNRSTNLLGDQFGGFMRGRWQNSINSSLPRRPRMSLSRSCERIILTTLLIKASPAG